MGHCYQQLQEWERSEINRLLCLGRSQAEIGRQLGRAAARSTARSGATRCLVRGLGLTVVGVEDVQPVGR
jgi:hypothetical protein